MCLEKAVKSRKRGNAGHGFYSSTLITHNNQHRGAASRPAIMDVITRLYTRRIFRIHIKTKRARSPNPALKGRLVVGFLDAESFRGSWTLPGLPAFYEFHWLGCRAVWCPSTIRDSLKLILILLFDRLFSLVFLVCLFFKMSGSSFVCLNTNQLFALRV